MFHHQLVAIEAHLTIVFAALAVARHLQDAAGTSIKKIIQTLHTARSATIEINGQRLTLDPDITNAARDILQRLETGHYKNRPGCPALMQASPATEIRVDPRPETRTTGVCTAAAPGPGLWRLECLPGLVLEADPRPGRRR